MATKTITGSYASGYYLQPKYQGLNVARAAYVGGAGVTTSASQASTIANNGQVVGTGNGITLSDGGTITNNATSSSPALIQGTTAIVAQKGAATINNAATIQSTTVQTSYSTDGYYYKGSTYAGPSISLQAGGRVSNTTTSATISNGVSIAGGAGTVINRGTIGGSVASQYSTYDFGSSGGDTGDGVRLAAGGYVNNGANGSTSAKIAGISIAGGGGKVVNNGEIGASGSSYSGFFGGFSASKGASVTLLSGGSVANGTGSNRSARIDDGVVISGQAGSVVNNGTIAGGYSRNGYSSNYGQSGNFENSGESASVQLTAGGSVVNGSAANTAASLSNGISISGATGSVDNFGAIGGASSFNYSFYRSSSGTSPGIALSGGGTVTNEASGTTGAIAISGGAGTVVNLGSVGGAPSSFYSYNGGYSASGISVQLSAGGSVVNGSKTNASATLSNGVAFTNAAATLTNFGTIGAYTSTYADAATGVAVSFDNAGDRLIEEGTGVLDGTVVGGGGTLELAGDAGSGKIDGIGSTIGGFATILVDADAAWTITGAAAVASATALDNLGSLTLTGALTNDGTLDDTGTIALVDDGAITNQADGTVTLEDGSRIQAGTSATGAGLVNAGLLQKSAGPGTAVIRASVSDTGRITIAGGQLELTGPTTRISGAVGGAGTLWLGPGTATLADGAKLSTGGLRVGGNGSQVRVVTDLSYAGTFTQTAASELTIGDGSILTLTGAASLAGGTIDGSGRLTTRGTTTASLTTLGGAASWANYGTLTETAKITLGNGGGATSVLNQSGASFDIAGNVSIVAGDASGRIFNSGLLAKTAGTGRSTIGVTTINSGTIEAETGTLELSQTVSGTGGTLTVDGGATLQLDTGVGSGQTALFQGSGGTLILGDARRFSGSISGFAYGEKLDLASVSATGTTFRFVENADKTSGVLTATGKNGRADLTILGNHVASGFHVASDGHGGTLVTYDTGSPLPSGTDTSAVSSSLDRMVQAMSMMTPSASAALTPAAPAPTAETHLAAAHA